jgi:hypothetical protein
MPSTAYLACRRAAAALGLALLATDPVSAATVIGTGGSVEWAGDTVVPVFKDTIVGQVFKGPADRFLQSFTFMMGENTADVAITGAIYAWFDNGVVITATGAPLFRQTKTLAAQGADGFAPLTFETGGLELTPGASYVAFVSWTGGHADLLWNGGLANQGDYADGYAAYQFGLNPTNPLRGWTGRTGDLAFRMDFAETQRPQMPAPVPLPAAGVLAAAAFGSLALFRRRHRD